MADLTLLLASAREGNANAAEQAFSLLYGDLRRLARSRLRQHQAMTLLDTTSLVHEAYLKLFGGDSLAVDDRHHFFAYASKVMRSVIVDFARARLAERRGSDLEKVVLRTDMLNNLGQPESDVVRVHEALEVLAHADPKLAQMVELRYFGGLTEAEVGKLLDQSERTVRRNWKKAKLLLTAALS